MSQIGQRGIPVYVPEPVLAPVITPLPQPILIPTPEREPVTVG